MPIDPEDLKPGVFVRIRNGHHRGAVVEVIAVYGRNVQFRFTTRVHGGGRGKQDTRLLLDFLMKNGDVVDEKGN